jgi:hypothetical protein
MSIEKQTPPTDKLAFCLMLNILDLVKDSGANQREAKAALSAASAMLSELNLHGKPTMVVQT